MGGTFGTCVYLSGLTGGLIIGTFLAGAGASAETVRALDPDKFAFADTLLSYAPKQRLDHSEPWHPAESPAPAPRLYGGAEYLFWSVKGAPLSVPLVSTGPIATTHHGLLGPPAENGADSTVLYGASHEPAKGGNDTQNFPGFSGTRLTLGYWLDDTQRFALEASGFLLASQSAGYANRGDMNGNPVLGIPVHNSVSYNIGGKTIFPGEDSLPFSLPNDANRARSNGIITGGVDISNALQLWGAGATAVMNFYRNSSWELSGLVGFRYLDLAESFHLGVDIEGLTGPYTGQSGVAQDLFQTRNQFYGGTLGLRGRYVWGPVAVDLTGSAAIGVSHETINIAGGFTSVNFSSRGAGPEGVFAQPANEGVTSANRFAVVPEANVKLSYDLTPRITVSVGYDFLYYSDVVRPTDQIDRNIPKGQTFLQAAPTISSTSPARLFNTTSFYAQGLSVGVSARF